MESALPTPVNETTDPAALQPSGLSTWRPVAGYADALLKMRQTRRRRFVIQLGLFVGLPTLMTLLYMLFIASPRYNAEFQATYQTYRGSQSLASGVIQSFAGTSESNAIDLGSILYEYIRSPALLNQLDRELHLREHYSDPKIDPISRLSKTASNETFLNYYRRHITVAEGLGGYLTVDVQAFDPQLALAIARRIASASDAMTDQITLRARSDEIKVAENEVEREEARIRKARLALAQFQNAHGDIDPERAATQLGDIVGKLESDLATAREQLGQAQHDLSPSSPIVVQLKTLVGSLQSQLQRERSRLAGGSGNAPYSLILEQYSQLQLEQEFAKNAYLAAQQGLAVARADASRKETYLVDFAPPRAPDRPSFYFSAFVVLSVFIGTSVAFGFGNLLVGAFRDQAGL
jgi:capsular polysaccharide transport system permease protein